MSENLLDKSPDSLARRKEELIHEGAQYRAAIRTSRGVVNHNMHVDVMARSVVNHMTGTAYTAMSNILNVKSGNLQTLMPVILKSLSLLLKALLVVSSDSWGYDDGCGGEADSDL